MKINKLIFTQILPIALVVGLSAFLRFHNLSQVFLFTIDEEYLATFAKTIVDHFHVLWIGMSISNGFYLGPFWIYVTAFFLFLSHNNPLILAYVAASLGVLSTLLVFVVGWKMFGYRVGFLASLIYAASPLIVFFDQRYWNDTPVIFLSLTMLLSLSQTFKSPKWWLVFAAAFGLMFHAHLSIFPYIFLAGYLLVKQLRVIPKKIIIFSLAIFLTLYSPLLVFDYFHNWDNLTLPFRLTSGQHINASQGNILDRGQVLFQTLGRIYYLKPYALTVDENQWGCTSLSKNGVSADVDKTSTRTVPPFWLSALSLIILAWFILNPATWKNTERKLLTLAILLIVVSYLFLSTGALEYYLLGIFPLVIFVPAILICDLPRLFKGVGYGVVVTLAGLGIFTVINTNPALGMGSQREIIGAVMQVVQNEPFRLQELGGCRGYAGWRYLFLAYGKAPSRSSIDPTLGWLYPKQISTVAVKYSVVVVEKRALPGVSYPGAMEISRGGFMAYVKRND